MEVIPISFFITILLAVVLFLIGMCVNRVRDGEWTYVGCYNIFIGAVVINMLILLMCVGISFYVIGNWIVSI